MGFRDYKPNPDPNYDPEEDEYWHGYDYFLAHKDELLDEWDREWAVKNCPIPYETIDEIKAAYLKNEITKDSAWEYIIRKFYPIPKDASDIINSWS